MTRQTAFKKPMLVVLCLFAVFLMQISETYAHQNVGSSPLQTQTSAAGESTKDPSANLAAEKQSDLSQMLPHGVCLLWDGSLLLLHVISDSIIALAYFSIPIALIVFVRKRKDLAFSWIFLLFAAFIVACGTTHLMAIFMIWTPAYWLDGTVKALTATISLVTSILLWPLIPKAIALPSPAQLQAVNRDLQFQILQRNRDIAERKKAEVKFRDLLESAPDAVVIVNQSGEIVIVNGETEKLFKYARSDLLGKPVEILMPERFRQRHPQQRNKFVDNATLRPMGDGFILYGLRSDGTEFPIEISLGPIQTDEGILVTASVRDITQRKLLEEQLRAKNDELADQNRRVQETSRLKTEFLANMSHELRTPLNGIIGFAEIMHDEKVGPISQDHKEYLGDILTSARHLLQLINDVLDLSKVEAGKMEFIPEPTDPAMIVAEVRDIVRTLAAKKRISLETEIDPALAPIETDRRSLKQILYNYLSNALKFTPEDGHVIVRVKTEDAERFRVEVEDSGIGIKPEDLGELFIEFRQLDATAAKKYPGTGLGLALTKRIVEAQGGEIGVDSTPRKGSTFFALLPRVLKSGHNGADEARKVLPRPGAPFILIVEDEVSDRACISRMLQSAGYAVETVATGAEALVRCREQRFDAITLDIMLPDMSGRAVLEKLRERGLNQDTPVIVTTLLAHKGIVAGFRVTDILPKPVSEGAVLEALKRCGLQPHTAQPILVIDDDVAALKLAEQILQQLGYRAICELDAAQALETATKENPAAIVLDLLMPGMNGFEFLKRFRKMSTGRHTPVIIWTGKDLTELERVELEIDASSIARKDHRGDTLLNELENVLHASTPSTQP